MKLIKNNESLTVQCKLIVLWLQWLQTTPKSLMGHGKSCIPQQKSWINYPRHWRVCLELFCCCVCAACPLWISVIHTSSSWCNGTLLKLVFFLIQFNRSGRVRSPQALSCDPFQRVFEHFCLKIDIRGRSNAHFTLETDAMWIYLVLKTVLINAWFIPPQCRGDKEKLFCSNSPNSFQLPGLKQVVFARSGIDHNLLEQDIIPHSSLAADL